MFVTKSSKKSIPISVCIITKNECDKLEKCIKHIIKTGYEIVVVDTGSTDGTLDMLQNYTVNIYHFEWIDDFAAAKNYAISKASNDMVLVVDSDEYLTEFDEEYIETCVKKYSNFLGRIHRRETFINEAGVSEECIVATDRLFDRRLYHYAGAIHEQLIHGSVLDPDRDDSRLAVLEDKEPIKVYDTHMLFYHDGYDGTMEDRVGKARRNAILLEKDLEKYPDDAYVIYQLAKSYRLTDGPEKALEYYERVLTLDVNPESDWVVDMIVCYGYTLLELEMYSDALNLESIYDEFSYSSDYIFLMGLIYMNNALFENAVDMFLTCTKMNDDRGIGVSTYKSYYNAGVIKEALGDSLTASEYYTKAGNYPPAVEGFSRTFDRSFFLDEVRDGFFIPSKIKRLWYACYMAYKSLERTCDEVGVTCYAAFGTLLGVIRGGGYIPWDDDIDTDMIRHSFKKLEELKNVHKLPNGYALYDYHDSEDDNVARKWLNSDSIILSDGKLDEFGGFNYAINTDIFLLDYLPEGDDRDEYMQTVRLFTELKMLVMARNGIIAPSGYTIEWNRDRYEEVKKELSVRIGHKIKISDKQPIADVMEENDRFYERYSESDTDTLAPISYYMINDSIKYPSFYYDKWIEVPFESFGTIRIPVGYDAILRRMYGRYMNVFLGPATHEYPYFKSYENILKEDTGYEPNRYRFNLSRYNDIVKLKSSEYKSGAKEVWLFLSLSPESFLTMYRLWKRINTDDSKKVVVIPLPYRYKDNHSHIIEGDYMVNDTGYPDEVHLTGYHEFDIETVCPDVVVYNNPYDDYNESFSVHKDFYVEHMVKYAKKLVFIPGFKVREVTEGDVRSKYTLSEHLRTPGLIYADEVYVQSEGMKQVYVEILSDFIMNDAGTSCIDWATKIKVEADYFTEYKETSHLTESDIEFGKYIKDQADGRKILLYKPSAGVIAENGSVMIDKMKNAINILSSYSDNLYTIWLEDVYAEEILNKVDHSLWDSYVSLRDEVISHNTSSILYDNEDRDISSDIDMFYGDACIMMNKCRIHHKSILWETPDIDIDPPSEYVYKTEFPSNHQILVEGEWYLDEFLCLH